jgi:hypothetical protein
MSRKIDRNEPLPEGEDWIEWGGELIWAAGFTSGGAPYGLTLDQFRAISMQEHLGAGWARAKRALLGVLGGTEAQHVRVGWVKLIGDGLYRSAFAADVEIRPDPEQASGVYVALLPSWPAPWPVEIR